MTTIAYDGYDLVADTQATSGTQKVMGVEKIFEIEAGNGHPRCWVGLAGTMSKFRPLIKWTKGGCKGPEPNMNDEVEGILIEEGGRVMILVDDEGLRWEDWNFPCAIGNGGQIALGAMLAGKSADKAVKIAAKVDTMTGGPVKVVNINPRKKRNKREKKEDGLQQVHSSSGNNSDGAKKTGIRRFR